MELEEVKQKILSVIPDAQVSVEGEGCNFSVTVVSDSFAGKMPVVRQKLVMGPFKELITSGDVHALGVKAYTTEEYQNILVKL